jgi:hypothetical protein
MSTEQVNQVNTTQNDYMIDNINMNLSEYTLDELFNLFDIKITPNTNYNDLVSQIELNASKYINLFKGKNKQIAEFFEKAKNILIKSDAAEPNSTIIQYAHNYNPFSQGAKSENNGNMFNSNNGAGNPIHRQTVTKLFNIDSRFRENYSTTTSSDFTIDLQNPQDKIIELKLCDLELPTTYYPISTSLGNNYMWVKYRSINTNTNIDNTNYIYVHIPDGNYYFSDLISYINGDKCLGLDTLTTTPMHIFFDLNYSSGGGVGTGTGKVTFGVFTFADISAVENEFTSVELELNFAGASLPIKETISMTYTQLINNYGIDKYNEVNNINLQNTFGWLLGYRKKLYNNDRSYISESVMDIIGPRYLYLVINDGNDSNTNSNFFSTSGSGLPSDTIARISLKGAAFSIQSGNDYSVYTEPRYYFGPVRISKFRIRLMDEYQRIIDLNNNDISFTLRMIVVYSAT